MRALFLVVLIVLGGGALFFLREADQAMVLSDAKAIPVHGVPGAYSIGVTMRNHGVADRLTGARMTGAGDIGIVQPNGPQDLHIPGQGSASLAQDGAHILISGLDADPGAGGFIPFTLIFETAGEVTTRAEVGSMADMDHSEGVETSGATSVPMSVKIHLTGPPTAAGFSVRLETTGFRFVTVAGDAEHVPGEGHAHLYLNGLKLGRIYQPSAAIGALPPGDYVVRIVLNTNDHRSYRLNSVPVSDQLMVRIAGP